MDQTNNNFQQPGSAPVSDRMRELLSRAAQDHVYEQRSQGAALDEIRQRLEGMEWLLREVRERELGGLTGQMEALKTQVEELSSKPPEWAEKLAEHVDSVGKRVEPINELPSLWADVGMIAENVDETMSRVQTAGESAKQIAEATEQSAKRLDEFSKRMEKLQSSMEAASVRFNRLDKSIAELGHRAEKLEHELGSVSGRVDQSLSDMTSKVEHGLDGINGRVEGVGGRLDGLDGRFEGVDGKLEGVDDRIRAVTDRVTQLPATMEVSELHRRLTELAERPVVDHSERFDTIDRHLGENLDPLGGELRARPDRDEVEETMSKIIESSHSDTTKRLDTLEETVLALAEALLRPQRDKEA